MLTEEFNNGLIELNLKSVSKTTVARALKSCKMFGRVGAKKPLLRKENIKKRLKFALEHKNWTIQQWSKVLWSDESKFELFGSKRRTFIRRTHHERFHSSCVIPTVKHGGGSVMVWGSMCSSGTSKLHRIVGTMDGQMYHSILSRRAIPAGKKLIGNGFIFQQDNDPKHKTIRNMKYLSNKTNDGNFLG